MSLGVSGRLRRGCTALAKRVAAPVLLSAILAVAPGAARSENLLDALAAAYRYNPQLDAERARLRATDEGVARAIGDYRPLIDLRADAGHQNTQSKPATVNEGHTSPRGYSVQLIQPVFRGFRTTNAVNSAEAAVRAGRETLRGVEQEVLQDAVEAYADVVRDQAIVRLRESNLQFISQELQATRDRFAVGEVTRTDVAQAEARRAASLGQLDFARANLKASRARYEQVVGNPPNKLSDPGLKSSHLPRSLDEAIGISSKENPAVVAALYREQGARFDVDTIRGELLPEAQLEATWSERYDSSRQIDENETASIVGRVNVPIYEGGIVYARVRAAKHTHISRIQEIEQNRALAQSQVAQAWAQLQGARAQMESDKAQIEANRIALNGVREEEKVGQRQLLDILNAQVELLQSQEQLEGSKRNTVVFTYQVIAAIGRLNVAELGAVGTVYDPEPHYHEVRRKWIGTDITHDDARREHGVDEWNTHVERAPTK